MTAHFTRESLTALLNVLLMQPFQTEQFRFVYDTSVSIGGISRGYGIGITNYNEETYCRCTVRRAYSLHRPT
jgi:hypothetical protein